MQRALCLPDRSNFVLIAWQDENKVVEKTNRQKTMEVEKLTQTIHELKESVLVSNTFTNAVRDYQRQISELKVLQIAIEFQFL